MGALEESILFMTALIGIFAGSSFGVDGQPVLGLLVIAPCAAALAILWPCLREHERGQRRPYSLRDAVRLAGRSRVRDRIHLQCFMLALILWAAEARLMPDLAAVAGLVTLLILVALGMVLGRQFPPRHDYPRPRHDLPWAETL